VRHLPKTRLPGEEVGFQPMIRKGLAGGSFKPLSEEAINKIHHTAMRVMAEVGFEVNSPAALELFFGYGARVDEKERRVYQALRPG
jgi:trimethylamine:corrinoid methyltransferase-like protein